MADNEGAVAQRLQCLAIDIEADATVGYASIQNSVPVVRALRVANLGEQVLEGVELSLTCNPAFARGARFRFERLAPHEARTLTPVDLHPDHDFLSSLQEALAASITAVATADGEELAREVRPIQVLAYDQWAGTRALPELLAAFCMPNTVDVLVGKASQLLRKSQPELSMSGYQSKSREVVWAQVSALYSAIAAENLQYAEPPASFGNDGQKIRTPDRILEAKVATCLDLAMLFASCLEQAGLRPVVMFKQGHAWVGVWLHQASFAHPLIDDAQDVRKRIGTGEFIAFETTGVAQHPAHRPSLRIALERAQEHLDGPDFLFAVDVFMARGAQIKPLPSRMPPTGDGPKLEPESEPQGPIEEPPDLPPLDDDTPREIGGNGDEKDRLSNWKAKLLDLTLRNRLLNFKTTKTTLQLIAPDLAALEDSLAEGAEFLIKPLPASFAEGSDPRMSLVHAARHGRTPLDDMASEALANMALIAKVRAEALDGNLLSLHSAAKTGQEEGGANTLYLALGLLKWTEAEKSDLSHLAPILLVPVTLSRQSVRSGYRLTRHDDEAIINPTLLQLLKSTFELKIAGLDVMPTDEKGVDVPRVLQTFRLAIREIAKWEVLEEAHLGIFSFTKYLMWKDLQDRTEQLKGNRVVKHLIENPGQAFPGPGEHDGGERRQLDEAYKPQDIFAPMLCDSSQLTAICSIDSGRDLVLEGPPGTGKSQTITNVIAHSLAKGKTVLFVSEKMAALEVVHRRLNEIGLAPFCLELHSSKSKKTDVLAQLGKSLELSGARTANDWEREAGRLSSLRQELNDVVAAIHREYPNGLDAHSAMGTCIENNGQVVSEMPWTDPNTHSQDDLEKLRETARRISALGQALSRLEGHPLALVGHADWSPVWQDELIAAAGQASAAADKLKLKLAPLATSLGLADAGHSMASLAAIDHLADVLLGAPKVPVALARRAHDPTARARVLAVAKHGRARQEHWERVGSGWTPQLAKLNATELHGQWSQATNAWWPKSWFAKREVQGKLAAVREDGRPPAVAALEAALRPLADVNDEDLVLAGMQAEAEALLQESYLGIQTDWSAVDGHASWAKTFSDATVRLAAGEVALGESLKQRLDPLVGEQRALLAPSGAVGRNLVEFRDAYRELLGALDHLMSLAEPTDTLIGAVNADGALERLQSHLLQWQRAQRALQPWCLWRKVREEAMAKGLQGLVATVERGQVALSEVELHFEHSYRSWWLKRIVDADPVLRGFSSADHERKIQEFRAADTRFQKLTQEYIAALLRGKVPSSTSAVVGADSEMGRLRRELQKQRKHMPVRQLVQGLPTLLPKLKPCLLMSPLSVAQYLAAGHSQFDLVVFDEASQIAVWDAVGVIARGKQVVVVGDPKQLPPTNFFTSSSGSGDGAGDGQQVEDLESILDECLGAGMKRLSLKWHYRSRHESLITFSNVHYYDSELVTFPSPVTDDVAVRFQPVAGLYDRGGSRTNRGEADAIVDAVEQHYLKEGSRGKSLGIVTFNQTQQALILTLLDARRRTNAALDKAIAQATQEPLFVKNLENVQGDERDIILFSITYGPDAAGKVTMNFGPLNGEGGHRRLNVAISRARHGVVIFSTLKPEQIDLSRVRAAGVRDLKHYLEFALRGPRAIVEQSSPTGQDPDSPFEEAVIKMLRDKGWAVHPQVGCSGYRVDLGIVDPRAPGRYLAGVECDGRTYHSAATARDRDRLRQHVLEGLGWRLLRIWSTDWWLDPQRELEKVLLKLSELLEEPADPVEDEQAVEADEAGDSAVDGVGPDGSSAGEPPDLRGPSPASLPHYVVTVLARGTPDAFYEHRSAAALEQQIITVVNTEGPVLDSVLFKRVARAWGLERTGPRIVERLRNLTLASIVKTVDGDKTFYWAGGSKPADLCQFRVANDDEGSRRSIAEVSLEEVAALMRHVLDQAGSSSRLDLARTSCRLLGMSRMTSEAEMRALAAADLLVSMGLATHEGDVVRLSP